jgi:hypothetical protein
MRTRVENELENRHRYYFAMYRQNARVDNGDECSSLEKCFRCSASNLRTWSTIRLDIEQRSQMVSEHYGHIDETITIATHLGFDQHKLSLVIFPERSICWKPGI